MNRADLARALMQAENQGVTLQGAAALVDELFETLTASLAQGQSVKITGFGTFALRDKRERTGRNPRTGDPIVIAARRVLSFKTSENLKRRMNAENRTSVPQDRAGDAPPALGEE